MKALKSLAIVSVLALSACGGGIGSKEDAAKALSHLMTASSGASSSVSQGLTQGLIQKVTLGGSVTVSGKSGTATVTLSADGGSTGASSTLDIEFSGYSVDGKHTFEGTETYSVVTSWSGTSATATAKLKAEVTMSGEYDAKVTCDVSIAMSVTDMSATGGKASMTINGTVTADGKSYTFDNETFEVSRS